ncbi:MAG: sugar-binding transcriptional regulator [Lachnospiraceae bacterium]|nr:sugar-binding transcriptional regulator [Lachnospiraceae bacterium]
MGLSNDYQIMRIARKYYDFHIGQLEIAQEEGISKSTVSRILKKAHELGYVTVTVNYDLDNVDDLAVQIKDLFNLKEVFIVPKIVDDDNIVMQDTCRVLAGHLDNYIEDGATIGVSWGKTMNCLSQCIRNLQARHIQVVQLNGSVSNYSNPTGAVQIVEALAKNGKGESYMLPAPAIVDSKEIADVLRKDSQVKKVLEMADSAPVNIFSIGSLTKDSILYKVGYFDDATYDHMIEKGAVGDIASHFFREDGQIAALDMDERVIGLCLEAFKKKKYSIAIAVGKNKVKPIIGALKGGYANILYTDEETAKEILHQYV